MADAATVGVDGPRNESLAAAARFERDHRLDSYSRRINDGRLTDPAAIETATIDYQCWVAIAEWIETGRFMGFHGGGDPQSPGAPWVSWPELEAAAQKALDGVATKLAALEGKPNVEPETMGALRARRSCLFAIHRKVALRRESIDAINNHFRTQREGIAA